MDIPSIGILCHCPNLASHGHTTDWSVKDHSSPSYPKENEKIVLEQLMPVWLAIVLAIVPFLVASAVIGQLGFFPEAFPDQVALLIAAPVV